MQSKKCANYSNKQKTASKLSKHVATRWYRPPEVIFMEDYARPMDIWAAGCIFGELLQLDLHPSRRTVLFPGQTCVTLSPPHKNIKEEINSKDQIEVILNVLGHPSKEDMGFITNPQIITFLNNIEKKAKRKFSQLLPRVSEDGLDLLDKMLQFNPYKRPTIEECINHSYFNEINQGATDTRILGYIKTLDDTADLNNEPLDFEFDKDPDFNMDKFAAEICKIVQQFC